MTLEDTKAEALAVIKAQLAQHNANVCPCGVPPRFCKEHGSKTETEEKADA